jgi:hypothetical protein
MMPGGLTAESLQDRLGELVRNDARMAPLVQHLQERLAAKQNGVEAIAEEESGQDEQEARISISGPAPGPGPGAARVQQYKSLARRLFTELERVRERTSVVADALGACSQCWGEDAACQYCNGNGCIGAYLINTSLFESVVGPALEQLRQRPPLVQQNHKPNKGEANNAIR